MPKKSKHTEASFSPISTDSSCLRVAQMPRSPKVVIFVPTTTDVQTDCFTPCTCARSKKEQVGFEPVHSAWKTLCLTNRPSGQYGFCVLIRTFSLDNESEIENSRTHVNLSFMLYLLVFEVSP